MPNILGNKVTLTLFGESHGEYIGGTMIGVPAGIKIDDEYIAKQLIKRRPQGAFETSRIENDDYSFISGVLNGYTTGAPLTVLIRNCNTKSSDYNSDVARPSHADFVAKVKYDGFNDYRGGGYFSGRLTAVIVLFGAILQKELEEKLNIKIGAHIKSIYDIEDRTFDNVVDDLSVLDLKKYPTLLDIEDKIEDRLAKIKKEEDSVGGTIECAITNLPVGVGEPWFINLEGEIAKAMFAIPAIKGIEFGLGFKFKDKKGSEVNDYFRYSDGKVVTMTNNNGGINGGISNGMPVIFNVVIKPTPSIGKEQQTIDMKNKENCNYKIVGRHDPCIVKRANVVVSSMAALVIFDMLSLTYGNDFLNKGK